MNGLVRPVRCDVDIAVAVHQLSGCSGRAERCCRHRWSSDQQRLARPTIHSHHPAPSLPLHHGRRHRPEPRDVTGRSSGVERYAGSSLWAGACLRVPACVARRRPGRRHAGRARRALRHRLRYLRRTLSGAGNDRNGSGQRSGPPLAQRHRTNAGRVRHRRRARVEMATGRDSQKTRTSTGNLPVLGRLPGLSLQSLHFRLITSYWRTPRAT